MVRGKNIVKTNLFNNLIHPDDVIYNALLDGGRDEEIGMKCAVMGAVYDSLRPENDRNFYKDDPEFMNKLLSIIQSAWKARPEKVKQTIKQWIVEVGDYLQVKE